MVQFDLTKDEYIKLRKRAFVRGVSVMSILRLEWEAAIRKVNKECVDADEAEMMKFMTCYKARRERNLDRNLESFRSKLIKNIMDRKYKGDDKYTLAARTLGKTVITERMRKNHLKPGNHNPARQTKPARMGLDQLVGAGESAENFPMAMSG